jgi:VCBS repeat-containing protein
VPGLLFVAGRLIAFRSALLAAVAEQHPIANRELLLQLGHFQLELLGLFTFELAHATLQIEHLCNELAILAIEHADGLAQRIGVVNAV